MTLTLPSMIYRYRPVGASLAYTITEIHGSLFCAHAHVLNDPFDGLTRGGVVGGKIRSPITLEDRELDKHWAVACFSETFENSAMWAHYASGFEGVCLGYCTNTLKALISNVNAGYHGRDYGLETHLERVAYLKSFPKSFGNSKQALKSKTDEWEYEKEWRILTQAPSIKGEPRSEPGIILDFKGAIKQIILGPNTDFATRSCIRFARDAVDARIRLDKLCFSLGEKRFWLKNKH